MSRDYAYLMSPNKYETGCGLSRTLLLMVVWEVHHLLLMAQNISTLFIDDPNEYWCIQFKIFEEYITNIIYDIGKTY